MRDSCLKLPERHSHTTLFEVEFPIYPCRIGKGEQRLSLERERVAAKPYINPLLIALELQEALNAQNIPNQTELAKSLNYTRARINQYLRLLRLPEEVKEAVLSGRIKATERGLRRMLVER